MILKKKGFPNLLYAEDLKIKYSEFGREFS